METAESSYYSILRSPGVQLPSVTQEVSTRKFEIAAQPSDKGYYRATDTIIETNGKPDREGSVILVGDVASVFIKFDAGLQWFSMSFSETEVSCFARAHRIESDSSDWSLWGQVGWQHAETIQTAVTYWPY